MSAGDERCPNHEDGLHCNCWYDGEACCGCGAAEMSEEAKVAQGMVEGPPRDPGVSGDDG